jgi:CubicO group peptidase (beta-lactamase class C family)
MPEFSAADAILDAAVDAGAPAAQLVIRWRGEEVFARAYGWVDPASRESSTTLTTRFDLASLTKLFAVTAFMTLVEAGAVALDQRVNTVIPAFSGFRAVRPYEHPLRPGEVVVVDRSDTPVDAGQVTFRQLLTHTSGLPAWRPLFRQPDAAAARALALHTFFSYVPGTHVVYSDIGLITLGIAIEQLAGKALAPVIADRICAPLGFTHTGYRPAREVRGIVAPTEFCAWRGRRVHGEVHDENAYRLGGVAAHAGLFSVAREVARFGASFLGDSVPRLLAPTTIAEMTREQAVEGAVRRGLGFALRSPDPEASGHPFGPQAFGHTGFTGTSLWMDPDQALVVALLTNEVYHGREARTIGPLRVAVHRAIVEALAAE